VLVRVSGLYFSPRYVQLVCLDNKLNYYIQKWHLIDSPVEEIFQFFENAGGMSGEHILHSFSWHTLNERGSVHCSVFVDSLRNLSHYHYYIVIHTSYAVISIFLHSVSVRTEPMTYIWGYERPKTPKIVFFGRDAVSGDHFADHRKLRCCGVLIKVADFCTHRWTVFEITDSGKTVLSVTQRWTLCLKQIKTDGLKWGFDYDGTEEKNMKTTL